MRTTLALLLFGYSAFVHAATIDPKVAKFDTCGRYELFHINGIMTDETGAQTNLDRIRLDYGNAYKEHLIAYRLAFNQTRGFKTDFLDAAKQVIAGYVGATWNAWMNAVTFGTYGLGLSLTDSTAIAKKVSDLFGFTKPSPYQDEDLNYIANKIVTQTVSSGRRLLVGHSQGNLYANLVYDKLIAMGLSKTMGLVGIAVPFNTLRTGNVYTTSANDVVVDAVRTATLALPGFTVLAPNVTVPVSTLDPLGHNLIQIYMANTAARDKIKANITAEFGTLKSTFPAVRYPVSGSSSVWYASVLWDYSCGTDYTPTGQVTLPECYRHYQVVTPYSLQWVEVMPGSLSAAKTTVIGKATACYALAVAGIKKAQLARPSTSSWAWFTMGYPNNYGCWDMISGNPATDYRLGAWWLYGGDKPPVWRAVGPYNPYGGSVGAEGGAVCNI